MTSFRYWAFWRRLQYGGGTAFFLLLLMVGSYYLFIYEPSSCFDNERNNDERGIDCGGDCVRICAIDVIPPNVQWAEAFKIVDGQYNLLAYVENRNEVASTPELEYTFILKDNAGNEITRESGTTILPPNSVYPIFEGRVLTGGREVTSVDIVLEEPELWLPATVGRDQFESSNIELEGVDLQPRLEADIENTELTEAQDVEIVATIFDRSGKPLTASQTFVDIFSPRSTERAVFTWPEPIAKTLRSCDVPTDAVLAIDLSGSMNNDQANPPEPITSVLAAASTFAGEFRSADQLSVVTFATHGSLDLPLTSNIRTAVSTIRSLSIDPAEESGSTNTMEALELVRQELNSDRHNNNARKVAVLLTDGLATDPEPDPELAALTEAARVKESGIELYTIGLGEEVNMDFLRQVADTPTHAYSAITTRELSRIYSDITTAICEEGPARIDIIPKTDANFAPLR